LVLLIKLGLSGWEAVIILKSKPDFLVNHQKPLPTNPAVTRKVKTRAAVSFFTGRGELVT